MKNRYRLFQRSSGIFFLENDVTRKQESLRTRDKATAKRILHARNEAHQQPAINLQIARAYLMVSDPGSTTRTWQSVMDAVTNGELVKVKAVQSNGDVELTDGRILDKNFREFLPGYLLRFGRHAADMFCHLKTTQRNNHQQKQNYDHKNTRMLGERSQRGRGQNHIST